MTVQTLGYAILFILAFAFMVYTAIRTWDAYYWEHVSRIRKAALDSLIRGTDDYIDKIIETVEAQQTSPAGIATASTVKALTSSYSIFQRGILRNLDDAINGIE
jgi:hypothetical protein